MSKQRLSNEAKILQLYDALSDEGRRIVYDLLRVKQPGKSRPPASSAPQSSSRRKAAKVGTSTSNDGASVGRLLSRKDVAAADALAEKTGASPTDCDIALIEANGDEGAAIQLLKTRGKIKDSGQ